MADMNSSDASAAQTPSVGLQVLVLAILFLGGGAAGIGLSLGIAATLGLYLLAGLAYGTACWLAARSGYLPFLPE